MGIRDDALKRIIAEVIQQDHRFKDILRRIVDRYPDATAAEIADAYRDVIYEADHVRKAESGKA